MALKKTEERLAKKRAELEALKEKVSDAQAEVTELERQLQAELLQKLQDRLKADSLEDVSAFIDSVEPLTAKLDAKTDSDVSALNMSQTPTYSQVEMERGIE